MAAPTVVAPTGPPDERKGRHARKRRWPRRLLIGLNVFVALCLIAVGSLYGYVSYRFGQIHRVTLSDIFHGTVPSGGSQSSGSAGPPMNILVVGSDTRTGLDEPGDQGFGSGAEVAGARSDTIMIVHLNPTDGTASLLSVPRDLWVSIPGQGMNRINSAFNNGPDLLVRTIQDDLGIEISHFVEVDFDTFRQVVNALGGVKFWYPEPVRDNDNGVNDSGLNITTPGCYTLTGNMALSLVRTRHMQYEYNGEWYFEAESDLARIRRQQLFVKKIVAKAQSQGLANVTKLNGVVGGIVSNLTVDQSFGEGEMIALVRRYRSFNPSNLPTATLPTDATTIDGQDVLLLDKQDAPAVIDTWEGLSSSGTSAQPSGKVNPTDISVQVLNGSGVTHQAATAAQALQTAGFTVSGTGEAPNFSYGTNTIEYGSGDSADAQYLESRMVGGAALQPDSDLSSGDLVLITGGNYQGINTSAPSTSAAPATTAAPALITSQALANLPGNTSDAPAFPGPDGQDPPPAGSGC
jgi:LCP family protein required for cell wall assembly